MRVLLAIAVLLLGGCEWLVPLDGLAGGDGGARPGCSRDLGSDRLNCGACGHSCLRGECRASRCQPVVVAEDQSGPLGIDVSPNFVFWVNQDPPGVVRWNKDGSGIKTITSPTDEVMEPFDVAADPDEKFIYWSELTGAQVYRKPIAGGDKMPVGNPGPGQAAFLALDGGQIYVSDYRMGFGSIATGTVLFSEQEMIGGLAVRGGVLYFARKESGQIMAGPTSGGTATVLVDAVVGHPMGVAVDEESVYWIEDGQRLKQASRRGGGTPVLLYEAAQPFGDSDVAVDATAIYWTEHGSGPTGIVRRLAR
jgi:hypothetical protein